MKIYIDVLIITNICLTLIFIECTAKLTHSRLNKKRVILSAVISGCSSVLAVFSGENRVESVLLFVIKTVLLLLTVFIAFNTSGFSEYIKYLFIYILTNMLFTGLCMILWQLGAKRIIMINAFTVYLDISLLKLMLAATITYIVLFIFEYLQRKNFSPQGLYHILLKIENLEYYLPAVADTGNTLTDVFTGKAVVIIASDKLYYHFELDREEIALTSGFHCIPFSTINGEGMINVTNNASIIIIDNKQRKKDIECAVGIISNGNGKERAIFSPSLIA